MSTRNPNRLATNEGALKSMHESGYEPRWSVHSKLFAFEGWLASYARFRSVVGNHVKDCLVRSVDGRGTFMIRTREVLEAARIGRMFYGNAAAVQQLINRATQAGVTYRQVCERVGQCSETTESDQIRYHYRELFDAYCECMAYYKVSADEFVADVETSIRNEMADVCDDPDDALQELLSPPETEGDMQRERRDWLQILKRTPAWGPIPSTVMTAVDEHARVYGYLGAVGGNPAGWTAAHFVARLEQARSEGIGEVAERLNAQLSKAADHAELSARREEALAGHAGMLELVRSVRSSLVNRLFVRECFTKGAFASNGLFQEVYRRIRTQVPDLPTVVLRQLSSADIDQFLESGKLDVDELKRRAQSFVMLPDEGRVIVLTGDRAEQVAVEALPGLAGADRVLGRIAWNRGIVEGRAFVLDSGLHQARKEELITQMQQGDVLITGMTHPNIIAACEKAAAMVTDEGGMTCHAAIVARELDVPCVVATRFATKVFNTGDIVRVDSSTGVVERRMAH